jgi:hypothetical protein
MTGLGYYQRRHIRQMEKLRRSEIIHEEEVKWQPLNVRCMGSACHLFGSSSCKDRKTCNALF